MVNYGPRWAHLGTDKLQEATGASSAAIAAAAEHVTRMRFDLREASRQPGASSALPATLEAQIPWVPYRSRHCKAEAIARTDLGQAGREVEDCIGLQHQSAAMAEVNLM